MMTIWDYDGDGRVDAAVLAPGCLLSILFNRTLPARSRDTDRDGILDVADPIAILRHFFFGGESPALGSRLRGDRRLPGAVPSMTGARAAIPAVSHDILEFSVRKSARTLRSPTSDVSVG